MRHRPDILQQWCAVSDIPGMSKRALTCVRQAGYTWAWEIDLTCDLCLQRGFGVGPVTVAQLRSAMDLLGFGRRACCEPPRPLCFVPFRHFPRDVESTWSHRRLHDLTLALAMHLRGAVDTHVGRALSISLSQGFAEALTAACAMAVKTVRDEERTARSSPND